MMKKRTFFAVLLALVLLLSGCALKTVDPVADANQLVLSVNGEKVTKAQMSNMVNNYTNNLLNSDMNALYYYYNYGRLPYTNEQLLDQTIQAVERSMVQTQKMTELGYDKLTEDELAEVRTQAEEEFNETLDDVISNHMKDTELTGDALREAAVAHAAEEGVTLESIVEELTRSKALEKMRADLVKDITVTDEKVKETFDGRVAEQKAAFDASAADYISALNNGDAIYYVPEGVRYVKHILIMYPDDAADAITDASSALDDAKAAFDTASKALEDAGDTASDDVKKAAADAQTALDDAQAAYDAAKDAANNLIKDKADEVYAKAIEEGADFDALVAEFGEDPGMKTEPYITEGYPVAAGAAYDAAFLETALGLEKIGDISEPVVSGFGMHVIKYESDAAAGEKALEDFRDSIHDELLTAAQDEAYLNQIQAWIDASDIKSYPEKMGL